MGRAMGVNSEWVSDEGSPTDKNVTCFTYVLKFLVIIQKVLSLTVEPSESQENKTVFNCPKKI